MGDSDSDEEAVLKTDEYGERFEDYGFIARAEEHKKAGNADFQKDRFEKALKEYDSALDQLLTVAYDKSIIIGKQKWNDVVVLRSTLHLNKSTCHYKLRSWRAAIEEAQACLLGNLREVMMHTDPQIRAKIREAELKAGGGAALGSALVEDRLPRLLRAKAWFRVSRCYANLEYLDRAQETLGKAREMCDEKQLVAELDQHGARLDVLARQQKAKEREKFRGFFTKLQDRGGYVDAASEKKARWEGMSYEERLKFLEELDDSDDESARSPAYDRPQPGQLSAERRLLPASSAASGAASGIERERTRQLNLSFEEYLERQAQGEDVGGLLLGGSGGAVGSSRPAVESSREADAPSRWPTGAAADSPYAAAEVRPMREEDMQRRQEAWRARQADAALDDLEDDELRKARERLATKRRQKMRGATVLDGG